MLCRRLALAFVVVVVVVQGSPNASLADDIQLTLLPDDADTLEHIKIWELASPIHLSTTPPITHAIAWSKPDVRREFDIEAKWENGTEQIGLRLYKAYLGRSYEIPIPHRTLEENELSQLSKDCANNSAISFAALLDDYYLCRDVFYQASEDSYAKLRAAKGWFDTAYRLAVLRNSPIRWDEQIARIMQGFEDRAAWNSEFSARYRNVVRRKNYVGDYTQRAVTAELHLSRNIGDLISDGRLEDAFALNRHVWNLFAKLSQETGKSVIDGVSGEVFTRNEATIRSRMGASAAASQPQDSP